MNKFFYFRIILKTPMNVSTLKLSQDYTHVDNDFNLTYWISANGKVNNKERNLEKQLASLDIDNTVFSNDNNNSGLTFPNGTDSGTISIIPTTNDTIYYQSGQTDSNVGIINVVDSFNERVFSVTAQAGQYNFKGYNTPDKYFNGTESNPTIYLITNQTLTFNVNVDGHPLVIKTVGEIGNSNLASGVTNNGAISGEITFTPTSSGTYYYQCELHSGMYGEIIVIDQDDYNNIDITTSTDNYVLSGYDSSFVKYENINDPTIYLKLNEELTFNITTAGQPITIMTTTYNKDGTYNQQKTKNQVTDVVYNSGLITYPNGTDSGTIKFTPTQVETLYYQSSSTSAINGKIEVIEDYNSNVFEVTRQSTGEYNFEGYNYIDKYLTGNENNPDIYLNINDTISFNLNLINDKLFIKLFRNKNRR